MKSFRIMNYTAVGGIHYILGLILLKWPNYGHFGFSCNVLHMQHVHSDTRIVRKAVSR